MREELARQALGGAGVELQTAAMFGALTQTNSPNVHAMIDDIALNARRLGRGSAAAATALRTGFVGYLSQLFHENGETFSDADLTTVDDWKPVVERLDEDLITSSSRLEKVYTSCVIYGAATPVKERNASQKVVATLVKDRFPGGARTLSVGSSIMAGELMLMNDIEHPVTMMSVTVPHEDGTDTDITNNVNRLLKEPRPFSHIVGVDIVEYFHNDKLRYDPELLRHALAGLRPSERNDPLYMGKLRSLLALKESDQTPDGHNSGVEFHFGNLLDDADHSEFLEKHTEPFDFIYSNFVTQELPHAQQLAMHRILVSMLSDNGVLMYNHQARIARAEQNLPVPISHVRPYKSYATRPWSSNSHILDMLHPKRGLQQAMTYYDNRCQIARVGVSKLMVNGTLEPVSELLARS